MTNVEKASELAGFKEGTTPTPTQRFVFDKCLEMAIWKDKILIGSIIKYTNENNKKKY